MKNSLLLFIILFLLSFNIAEAQTPTDAGIPDAYHILVVFNSLDQTSIDIKDYYQLKRGIPGTNIVPLNNLVDQDITIDEVTHRVKIVQVTDIIQDSVNNANNENEPTRHAFKYFLDNIATPIKTHLINHNLLTTVRYILLIKGVPCKLQAARDYGGPEFQPGNLTVDGLLCMLNTPSYDSLILKTVFQINHYGGLPNPYNNADPNFTMEYRFLPDHFIAQEGHHLSYLVSHLDGISYDVVKAIIDRSIAPDMSGTSAWIIDDDLTWSGGHFADAKDKLEELGFNVFYDHSDTWITHYPEKVIGYTSWGTHAEDGNCEWEDSAWVKDSLHFDLANGSVFNTYESFNGNSLTTLNWRYVTRPNPNCHHTQGLATQFTEIGGTGTMGHAWEPTGGGIVANQIFFPAYQMGYNLVDAIYQGLPSLAAQNVLVGDPLVRIYECENTVISTNTTIGSGDYECNVIVPPNVILTIASESTINFNRNAKLKLYGTLQIMSDVSLNFNAYSRLIIDSTGTLTISSGSHFVFNNHSKFIKDDDIEITSAQNFAFNDESEFQITGILNMDVNSSLTFNDNTILTVNSSVNLEPGTNMNFNNYAKINVFGSLISLGESSNKVVFNFSAANATAILVKDGMRLEIDNTVINYGGIKYEASANTIEIEHISIENSIFNNPINAISINFAGANSQTIPLISNCTFSNCGKSAITLSQVPGIIIEHNYIVLSSLAIGIHLKNNGVVNISDCIISGGVKGIFIPNSISDEIVIIENLMCDLRIEQSTFESKSGIEIAGNNLFNSILINGNHFQDCEIGININQFSTFAPSITNNILAGKTFDGSSPIGISLSNGNEVLISNNSITNFLTGINLTTVRTPYIKENTISAINLIAPRSGILAVSSNGEIRKNTIQHHKWGIELGSSSPNTGANKISDNLEYGIYIGAYSHPHLGESAIGEERYPVTGYNTISNNGLCSPLLPSYSEIYITGASIELSAGCNTISDDRYDPNLHCSYLYLIDGSHMEETIYAEKNYWGEINDHNPEGRFGEDLTVVYDGWWNEPCTYDEGAIELELANSKGEIYDTVYSSGETLSNLTDIESRYATANDYYYHNEYSQAKQEYEDIIQIYGDSTISLQAYNRLYTIANLLDNTSGSFNQLREFYLQKAESQTDSTMMGTLKHLSDLCLVSAEEYLSAINNFDEIAQQNPNTDIALYRQIDALTTSLLIPQDSTLNKGALGKYSVNSLEDYTSKLSELLSTRGKGSIEPKDELLPTEYTLYQNYPNPFNPNTTIKYDLPNASEVSLIIYDILGRKVKELVNEKQQAGRYEVQFDASNLASGVYIYQLIAEKYSSSKKMILLK